jgi:hypothetical protein
MGGRQFHRPNKSKQAGAGMAAGQPALETKPPEKAQLNKSDSIAIVGILLGLLFVIVLPPLSLKIPAFVGTCVGFFWLAHRSHWTEGLAWWKRTALGLVVVGFCCAVGVPQFISQWRTDNAVPTAEKAIVVLEQNIKEWASANHWPVTPIQGTIDGKPLPFEFMIGLPGTAHVLVFVNAGEWPKILQMQSKLFFSQDQLKILNNLSTDEAGTVMQEFELEMTRQKLNWKVDTQADQPGENKFNGLIVEKQSILLSNPTPIDSLNEFTFGKAIADMDNDVGFVYNQLDLILKRHEKKHSSLASPTTTSVVKATKNEPEIPFGPQPKYPPSPKDFPGASLADLRSQEELLTLSDGELRKRVGDLAVRLKAFDGSWTFHFDDRSSIDPPDDPDGTPNPERIKQANDEQNRRHEEDKERDAIYTQQIQDKFDLTPTHDELVSRCTSKNIDVSKIRSCDKYGSLLRSEGATSSAECLESMVRRCLN